MRTGYVIASKFFSGATQACPKYLYYDSLGRASWLFSTADATVWSTADRAWNALSNLPGAYVEPVQRKEIPVISPWEYCKHLIEVNKVTGEVRHRASLADEWSVGYPAVDIMTKDRAADILEKALVSNPSALAAYKYMLSFPQEELKS
jgi:hypothetical protein